MCIIAPVNSNYGKLSHQSIDELEVGASQRTGVEQQLKKTHWILLFGKVPKKMKFLGILLGERTSRLAY